MVSSICATRSTTVAGAIAPSRLQPKAVVTIPRVTAMPWSTQNASVSRWASRSAARPLPLLRTEKASDALVPMVPSMSSCVRIARCIPRRLSHRPE